MPPIVHPYNVVICGTGSAAHVLASALASSPTWHPTLFSLSSRGNAFRDELRRTNLQCDDAARASRAVATPHSLAVVDAGDAAAAAAAAAQADVVVLALPAFAHEQYLRATLPHCARRVVVLLMPAYGCADMLVRHICRIPPSASRQVHLALTEQLPWVCRTQRFGGAVRVMAHKSKLKGSMVRIADDGRLCAPEMSKVELWKRFMADIFTGDFHISLTASSLMAISLFNPNAMMHATLMFGFYQLASGNALLSDAFEQPPRFYSEVSDAAAAHLDAVSLEALLVKDAMLAAEPKWAKGLSGVATFHDWIRSAYSTTIEDAKSSASCLQTNQVTRTLLHPMLLGDDGKYRPDYAHRYMTEDVPFGLLPLKSLAETLRVATPALDRVIEWAQDKLKHAWLSDGKLTDCAQVPPARTYRRFGIVSLRDLQAVYSDEV